VQDKTAFIFCVEDRALFCQDCDESIHSASTLAANHQRYLATGIRVALGALSKCRNEPGKNLKEPCNQSAQQIPLEQTAQHPPSFSPPAAWAVDDLLEFPDLDSSKKVIILAAFIQDDLTLVALRFCLYLLFQTVSQVVKPAQGI